MRKALSGGRPAINPLNIERTLPAPVRGLNSRDPLAMLKDGDAIALDNFICRPDSVEVRKGTANFVTGLPSNEKVWALMPYRAAPNDKLFAATDLHIYDVTTAGVVGAAVTNCTSGRWETINGANAGIRYLLAVNGVDPMKFYNGTTWAEAAVTGILSSRFTNIAQFKFRVFFTEKDTLSFWYLGVNAVQGVATEFPLAPIFTKGGSLMACGNWTVDGGNGPDDYAAFITTEGELAVYKGTDPSNADAWSLVGVYNLPRPIGRKCLYKFGGDLLVITESGLIKMSSVLQSVDERIASISDKIIGDLSRAASLYKANFGWSLTLLSAEDVLILNVPVAEGRTSTQFVMNTLTGAWSSWSNINALCIAELGSRLFYGLPGRVAQGLTGQSDFGSNITFRAKTNYSNYGIGLKKKQIKLFKLNYETSKNIIIKVAAAPDYEAGFASSPGSSPSNNQAIWDSSIWNAASWASAGFIVRQWRSVASKPGAVLSTLIQIADKDFTFKWYSTDYLVEVGSAF